MWSMLYLPFDCKKKKTPKTCIIYHLTVNLKQKVFRYNLFIDKIYVENFLWRVILYM